MTLLGLLLVAVAWRRLGAAQRTARRAAAGVYCLGFMAMMTIGPKKFDRYLLPLYPMLGLLAGLGAVELATRLLSGGLGDCGRQPSTTGAGGAGRRRLAPGGHAAAGLRYPLAYYSPLLGGGAVRRAS